MCASNNEVLSYCSQPGTFGALIASVVVVIKLPVRIRLIVTARTAERQIPLGERKDFTFSPKSDSAKFYSQISLFENLRSTGKLIS